MAALLTDRHPHKQQGCRYAGSIRHDSEQVAPVSNAKEEEDPFLNITVHQPESGRPRDVGLQALQPQRRVQAAQGSTGPSSVAAPHSWPQALMLTPGVPPGAHRSHHRWNSAVAPETRVGGKVITPPPHPKSGQEQGCDPSSTHHSSCGP